jgi:hypothetical protein
MNIVEGSLFEQLPCGTAKDDNPAASMSTEYFPSPVMVFGVSEMVSKADFLLVDENIDTDQYI